MIKFNKLLKKIIKEVLSEGGVGGHMAHPFDFASDGKELIDIFNKTILSLEKGDSGSVKIDGVNSSIRLVDGRFVMDRGSAKAFDLKGMRPEDLPNRFAPGHGFIKIGSKVINIFDEAIPSTKSELKSLGLLDNPNILLNIEYVEGQTNVVGYDNIGNFLAIHGLKEIKPRTFGKDGSVKSRSTVEIPYDKNVMQSYINKLNVVAKKHEFKVLGSVDTKLKSRPKLNSALNEKITFYPEGLPVTKTLNEWLNDVKIETPLITRKEFLNVTNSKNLSKDFEGKDVNRLINDSVVYLATVKLGDEILKQATSEIGDLSSHEGIVIRDPSIYKDPYKITGSFLIRGMGSEFGK